MPNVPDIHATTLVIRGGFSPVLFQPAWLASKGLISDGEATAAKIEMIHPKAAVFSTEWLDLRVTEDRFQATTQLAPYFELLRDLVAGVFRILPQLPFQALGINHTFHFKLESKEAWHRVGHRLAPKEHWGVLEKPGMRSIAVEGMHDDEYPGFVRVRVEPSAQIAHGLFIDVNDHFQIATDMKDVHTDTRELLALIAERWDRAAARSQEIADSLIALGKLE
jgi:hypothetical protein